MPEKPRQITHFALDHVLNVICSGEREHYDYLIRWMANAVQNPAEPGHVAVVLRGVDASVEALVP